METNRHAIEVVELVKEAISITELRALAQALAFISARPLAQKLTSAASSMNYAIEVFSLTIRTASAACAAQILFNFLRASALLFGAV